VIVEAKTSKCSDHWNFWVEAEADTQKNYLERAVFVLLCGNLRGRQEDRIGQILAVFNEN